MTVLDCITKHHRTLENINLRMKYEASCDDAVSSLHKFLLVQLKNTNKLKIQTKKETLRDQYINTHSCGDFFIFENIRD